MTRRSKTCNFQLLIVNGKFRFRFLFLGSFGGAAGKDVVIIAHTGWGAEEDRQRTLAAGFDHHLVKPVDPQVLSKILADLMLAKDGGRV